MFSFVDSGKCDDTAKSTAIHVEGLCHLHSISINTVLSMQVWNAGKGNVDLFVHYKCSPLFLHFSIPTFKTSLTQFFVSSLNIWECLRFELLA